MSNYQKYTKAEREAWGRKMAAARAAKKANSGNISGYGAYYRGRKPAVRRPTRTVRAPKVIKEVVVEEKQPEQSFGAKVGSFLGHGIQQVVKALTGFGDYSISENSILNGTIGGDPPKVVNSPNGMIIRHREYIDDVYATVAFNNTSYPINPGLGASFPWLAQVASSFEQYRFRGLVFEFKSMSSDAVLSSNSSSALGTVIMGTQYNSLDVPFSDKRTMENYEYSNSCKPSCSMMHPIECKKGETSVSELYIRVNNVPTTADIRLYDLGNFQIATQGMQNAEPNEVIGELWCTFEIEFFKPKLLTAGQQPELNTDHWVGTNATLAAPFNVGALSSGSTLQATYAANGQITFPITVTDGLYLLSYNVTGASANFNPGMTITNTTNIQTVTLFQSGGAYQTQAPAFTESASHYQCAAVLSVTQTSPGSAPSFKMTLTGTGLPTGVMTIDCIITLLNAGIN